MPARDPAENVDGDGFVMLAHAAGPPTPPKIAPVVLKLEKIMEAYARGLDSGIAVGISIALAHLALAEPQLFDLPPRP